MHDTDDDVLCEFRIYYSQKIAGSYAVVLVTGCSGIEPEDFLEYHITFPGIHDGIMSGRLTPGEIVTPGNSVPLAQLGKLAAETVLMRLLMEVRRTSRDVRFDPVALVLEEGNPADLWMLHHQGKNGEFLRRIAGITACPKLRRSLDLVSSSSRKGRSYTL